MASIMEACEWSNATPLIPRRQISAEKCHEDVADLDKLVQRVAARSGCPELVAVARQHSGARAQATIERQGSASSQKTSARAQPLERTASREARLRADLEPTATALPQASVVTPSMRPHFPPLPAFLRRAAQPAADEQVWRKQKEKARGRAPWRARAKDIRAVGPGTASWTADERRVPAFGPGTVSAYDDCYGDDEPIYKYDEPQQAVRQHSDPTDATRNTAALARARAARARPQPEVRQGPPPPAAPRHEHHQQQNQQQQRGGRSDGSVQVPGQTLLARMTNAQQQRLSIVSIAFEADGAISP